MAVGPLSIEILPVEPNSVCGAALDEGRVQAELAVRENQRVEVELVVGPGEAVDLLQDLPHHQLDVLAAAHLQVPQEQEEGAASVSTHRVFEGLLILSLLFKVKAEHFFVSWFSPI